MKNLELASDFEDIIKTKVFVLIRRYFGAARLEKLTNNLFRFYMKPVRGSIQLNKDGNPIIPGDLLTSLFLLRRRITDLSYDVGFDMKLRCLFIDFYGANTTVVDVPVADASEEDK